MCGRGSIKILFQVQTGAKGAAPANGGARALFLSVVREQGVLSLWKGNSAAVWPCTRGALRCQNFLTGPVQVLRVFPYAAGTELAAVSMRIRRC